MKKVLVDWSVLNGSYSGYRRIARNMLVSNLNCVDKIFHNYDFIYVFQTHGFSSLDLPVSKNIIVGPSFKNKVLRALFYQFYVAFLAWKHRVDVVFMPTTWGNFITSRRVLTFVHTNTSFRLNTDLVGRSRIQVLLHKWLVRMTYKYSDSLVFTSRTTYREYIDYLKVQMDSKILGNGLNLNFEEHKVTNDNFILTVSQIYRLKNFESIINAFLELNLKDYHLIIVGTPQELDYYEELKCLAKNDSRIVFKANLSDEELKSLFASCSAYVFMSRFEGYSLTPAEALIFGKPVILSNIEIHKEIYGDYADYADLDDKFMLMSKIKDALFNTRVVDFKKSDLSLESYYKRLDSFIAELL